MGTETTWRAMVGRHLCAARAWTRPRVAFGVATLAVTILSVLPAMAANPSHAEPVPLIRRVVHPVEPTWTIRWEARTSESGGHFRLYSGSDLENLRVVSTQQAAAGIGGYLFRHTPGGAASSFFELRYVTPAGRELVLAIVQVQPVVLMQVPASMVELPGVGAVALADGVVTTALAEHPRVHSTGERLAEAARPEPEVPPPRAAGQPGAMHVDRDGWQHI